MKNSIIISRVSRTLIIPIVMVSFFTPSLSAMKKSTSEVAKIDTKKQQLKKESKQIRTPDNDNDKVAAEDGIYKILSETGNYTVEVNGVFVNRIFDTQTKEEIKIKDDTKPNNYSKMCFIKKIISNKTTYRVLIIGGVVIGIIYAVCNYGPMIYDYTVTKIKDALVRAVTQIMAPKIQELSTANMQLAAENLKLAKNYAQLALQIDSGATKEIFDAQACNCLTQELLYAHLGNYVSQEAFNAAVAQLMNDTSALSKTQQLILTTLVTTAQMQIGK